MATRLLAAITCGLALLAGEAKAQQPDKGLFSVTPSRRVVVDRPPARLTAATVGNSTKTPLAVSVIPVLLGQQVSGAFTFSERPADLIAAGRILTADARSFTMAPGTTREVALDWDLLPTGARAAFVGVVFQARAQPADGQTVRTVQRLLTANFLRLPGPISVTGRFTRLSAAQGDGRTLLFSPRVKNTGDFSGEPVNARFAIRDAAGRIVLRRRWKGDTVLPGFQREFPITVRKVLPAGDYTAIARADFGRSKGLRIATRFRLAGPNRLPTGKVTLDGFRAAGTIGGDSRVTGVLESVGTKAADTAVRVDLYRLRDGQRPARPMTSRSLRFSALAPGTTTPLEVVYPDLPAGDYRVIGTYRVRTGSTDEVISDFSPQAQRTALQRFQDGLRRHRELLAGLGLLLLVALLVVVLLRRQRRLERALAAALHDRAGP